MYAMHYAGLAYSTNGISPTVTAMLSVVTLVVFKNKATEYYVTVQINDVHVTALNKHVQNDLFNT